MRTATKVLLIISEVLAFVGIPAFIIIGGVTLGNLDNAQFIQDIIKSSGWKGTVAELKSVLQTMSIIFIIVAIFSLVVAILTIVARRKFCAGCEKKDLQVLSILLIVFGVLGGCELVLVPAIFMLAMNKKFFVRTEGTKAVEEK